MRANGPGAEVVMAVVVLCIFFSRQAARAGGAHGLAQFLPASLKISTTRRKARARALALRE